MIPNSLSKQQILKYMSKGTINSNISRNWILVSKKLSQNGLMTHSYKNRRVRSHLNEYLECKYYFEIKLGDDDMIVDIYIEDESEAISILLMDEYI